MAKFYKNMSYDRALEKAMRYCSYQERCTQDLENRFLAWNVIKSDGEKILDYLIDEDYLNENRYIESYVRGKFKIKKWGKNKIKQGLKAKNLYNEKTFLKVFETEIEADDYLKTIKELVAKKELLINETDAFKKRDKLYRYMLGKGYESDLITQFL